MPNDMSNQEFTNWAFVCLSQKDERWRDWFVKHISLFRTPRPFVGKPTADGEIPRRIGPVATGHDQGNVAAELTESDKDALRRSRYLIVICTPNSAISGWVDEAVRFFKSIGREHRTLCLIAAGEPYASSRLDPVGEECLPRAVKYEVDAEGEITDTPTAPFAADARPGKDGRRHAFLKLAAGMLRVDFGELKQREHDRGQIRMTLVLAGALLLMVFFFLFGLFSFEKARSAMNEIAEARKAATFSESEFQKRQVTIDRQKAALASLNVSLAEHLFANNRQGEALARLAAAVRPTSAEESHVVAALAGLERAGHAAPADQDGNAAAAIPNHVLASVAEAMAGAYVDPKGALRPLDPARMNDLRSSIGSQRLDEQVKAWANAAFDKAEAAIPKTAQ